MRDQDRKGKQGKSRRETIRECALKNVPYVSVTMTLELLEMLDSGDAALRVLAQQWRDDAVANSFTGQAMNRCAEQLEKHIAGRNEGS